MLYIFHGDRLVSRDKARELVDVCKKKRPNSIYHKISVESDISPEEILYNQSLFDEKYIVFLDELSKSKDIFDRFEKKISEYCDSQDMFIMFDPDLNSKVISKFEKKGAVVKVFKKKEKEDFNSDAFKLLDIIVKRNKKESFLKLHQLIERNMDSESVLRLLYWQMRVILLAKESKNAKESGLKPFSYSKAKKIEGNFSKEELFNLYMLIDEVNAMYRTNKSTSLNALESFILSAH